MAYDGGIASCDGTAWHMMGALHHVMAQIDEAESKLQFVEARQKLNQAGQLEASVEEPGSMEQMRKEAWHFLECEKNNAFGTR